MAENSNRERAMQSMTTHQFVPKVGYIDHKAPPIRMMLGRDAPTCDPPAAAVDGSIHILRNGKVSLTFAWIDGERVWARHGGNRMAWASTYLAASGWKYVGLAPPAI